MWGDQLKQHLDKNRVKYVTITHSPAFTAQEVAATAHIPGREMAKTVMPYLPIGALISTQYDSLSKIGAIHAPLLILHGDRDDIIPYEHGRRLFAAANEPKHFYTIVGAHHNDTYVAGGTGYMDALREFLLSLPVRGPDPA